MFDASDELVFECTSSRGKALSVVTHLNSFTLELLLVILVMFELSGNESFSDSVVVIATKIFRVARAFVTLMANFPHLVPEQPAFVTCITDHQAEHFNVSRPLPNLKHV